MNQRVGSHRGGENSVLLGKGDEESGEGTTERICQRQRTPELAGESRLTTG